MSVFGNILSKLTGHSSAHAAPATASGAPPAAGSPAAPAAAHGKMTPGPGAPAETSTAPAAAAPTAAATPAATHGKTTPGPAASAETSSAPAAGATMTADATPAPAALKDVDVTAILDGLVAKAGQKLDWRHSIVDLLKALDLDSNLSARKELARELHYAGSADDTAAMNVWLIKQVIVKLKEHGGKLPADLAH
jgi:Domain of unknown function (DUF3597)